MSVLMPNSRLGVRRRTEGGLNAHGERLSEGWGAIPAFEDGLTEEGPDAVWQMGLDPSMWPVRQGDLIVSSTGQSWLVQTADLLTNSFDSTVNWIRATALLRVGTYTIPADPWNVARFVDAVVVAPDAGAAPTQDSAGLWTGSGPPPDDFGAQPGEDYVDLLSGTVYHYGET
jgi:hypothetical protein